MKIRSFETEEFFGKYEFTKPYLISASDCETVSIDELIRLGGGSVDELLQMRLGYTEMPGSAELRREIASLYSGVSEDQVLVLGSPIEGIYLTMKALLEPGDHAVLVSPAYDALFNIADHLSAKVSRCFLKNDGTKWSFDFAELEKLLSQPATKLLIMNFPHNPTGFIPSAEELDRIVQIAGRHGIRIFSDEMYRGLEYNPAHKLKSLAEFYERSICLSGASKSLGLPGLRFGWLVIPDPSSYKELLHQKTYTSMCSTQPNEYLGKMAIRATPWLVSKNLKIIQKNLKIAERFSEKWRDRLEWLRPLAGPISVLKIHEPSAEAFCHELAEKFGVVLLPIRFMGYADQYARLGLGRENFQSCMDVFDRALETAFSKPKIHS